MSAATETARAGAAVGLAAGVVDAAGGAPVLSAGPGARGRGRR